MLRNETGPESIGGRLRRLRLERQLSQRRDVDQRELRLSDAELELHLGQKVEGTERTLNNILDETFRKAEDLLQEHGHDVDFTDMCRIWARYLRRSGRDSEALDVLDQAAQVNASSRTRTLS